MQLISLWVEDFKNLKNFTINFENQENLSIIIGNNGSGKSNILELLSGVFAELYEDKTFIESSYTFRYSINDNIIEITKDYEYGEKDFKTYKVNGLNQSKLFLKTQTLLPNNIIALYSGEDGRLYKTYYEYFANNYLRSLSKILAPKNNMVYIDKRYWGIALLAFIIKAQEGNEEAQKFLRKELIIDEVLDIYLEFEPSKIKKLKHNSSLELFIRNINPGKSPLISMSIDFFYPYITNYNAEGIFSILSQGITTGAIKDVSVVFNNDNIPSEHMSEGEKKKLLVKATFDIVGTENSLILMDEPDAHLHIVAKNYFYNLAKQSSQEHRSIVITTHSPTLTNCAESKHFVMLSKNNDGRCEIVSESRKECINKLTNGLWTVVEQNIFMNSSKPLILFEGMDDVIYVKQAITYFYTEYPLDVEMLYFGGAPNAEEFIKNLKQIGIPDNKKITVLFDKDKGGFDGIRSCLKACRTNENINLGQIDCNDNHIYKNKNFYYLTYPKTQNCLASAEFVLEDYFTITTKAKFIKQQIKSDPYSIKSYKDLDEKIKRNIRKSIKFLTANEMAGFKTLLNKIKEIIDDDNIQNLVEIN